jgi:hypothetical protein
MSYYLYKFACMDFDRPYMRKTPLILTIKGEFEPIGTDNCAYRFSEKEEAENVRRYLLYTSDIGRHEIYIVNDIDFSEE